MEEIKENIKLCSLWIKMMFLHPTLACRKTHERSGISSTFPSGITGWFYLCQCKQRGFQPATGTIIFTSLIDYKVNCSSRSTSSLQACHHIPGHHALQMQLLLGGISLTLILGTEGLQPAQITAYLLVRVGSSLLGRYWYKATRIFLGPAFLAYLGFPSSKGRTSPWGLQWC